MKRKLDASNVPTVQPLDQPDQSVSGFAEYGLDPRLLQALVKEKFRLPTPVQAKAIPLALEGKDILARAKTGTGKTAAYVLPIVQSILKRKSGRDGARHQSALILVPTRELAEQVLKAVVALTAYCSKEVRAINLTHKVSDVVQRSLLADSPDVIISTPARASLNINSSALLLEQVAYLVIDEADLVLSYGYDEDLQNIAQSIPKGIQIFLMSATLTEEVDTLKGLFCRDPVVLALEEKDDTGGEISQYVVRCGEAEKFLLIFVIFKLKLIKGKCIIFVGDIDRCYRLKLFLEQFGVKGCVLNSELPVNSRIHVVEEFNKNVYDIIIATDEHEIVGTRKSEVTNATVAVEEGGEADGEDTKSSPDPAKNNDEGSLDQAAETQKVAEEPLEPSKKKQRHKKDKEYGISRGIDFKNVACVLNFDLPTSSTSYTHRIGRTARAGNTGMALSFVVPKELYRKHKPTSFPTAKNDEEVLEKITHHQNKKGKEIKPYQFDMTQVEAFRYRMDDALRAVTRLAIREARTREIRQELLKSEKLRRHFEENPTDLHQLRHDGESRVTRVQSHLKHIPDYLLPRDKQRGVIGGGVGQGEVGFAKTTRENGIRRARMARRTKGGGGGGGTKRGFSAGRGRKTMVDPLKTFRVGGTRR